MHDERSIIMENSNENNLFIFLDKRLLGEALQKIREFSAKDFARFSAITAVCFSIAIWVTRSLGYFYMLGRFSVYHIDKGYIDVWTEGFLIQVIQSVSTCIFLIGINYLYYKLSIPQEGKNAKRRLKKIGFILIEFTVLSVWVFYTNEISFIDLMKELPNTPISEILALIIVWCIVIIMVNAIGIEAIIFHKHSIKEKNTVTESEKEDVIQSEKKGKKKKRKKQSDKADDTKQSAIKYQSWVVTIEVLLITCIIEFAFMYGMGILAEKGRNEFKFVVEETETVEGDEYVFTDPNNGVSYYLYPIIYENQDVYILSQVSKREEGASVNYDFLKVIYKIEVSTHYVDNLKIIN